MDIQKLNKILTGLGATILAAAIIWWFFFYSGVINDLSSLTGNSKNLSDAFVCLYSSGGGCAFISGMAEYAGYTPYEPLMFWVGIIMLGLGLILKFTQKKEVA